MNKDLKNIPASATVVLADRVRKLKAQGRDIVALQTGDPDFETPPVIVLAVEQAIRMGFTHYCSSRGLPELRTAIAEHLNSVHRLGIDSTRHILITHGAVHGYFCVLRALMSPGDEVLVPDPTWMTHANSALMLGGTVTRVPSTSGNNFWPRREAWEASITPKTVALVINSPNNPTGAVADEDYLEDLVDLAIKHDLYIISDEVYESILFDGRKHTSLLGLRGGMGRVIMLNSFSKTYAMTGWRIGCVVGPEEVINLALKTSQNTITNVAPFIQRGALVALSDPDVGTAVQNMVAAYQHRKDSAVKLLDSSSGPVIKYIQPQGAFYLFLDIRPTGMDSLSASEDLLEKTGVAMVPGSAFGDCGEGFLRMTLAASDETITEGLKRFISWYSERRD